MQQKHFYNAFSILYSAVKDGLRISQKEELYRILFRDAYLQAGDDLYGNDAIRKVTAGSSPIHRKAIKALYSEHGFETLRANIERICLQQLSDHRKILTDMLSVVAADTRVPEPVKQMLSESIQTDSSYHLSKAAAGMLLCLDRSDYLCWKGSFSFGDVGFMRLSSNEPIPQFPRYLSDPPNAAVDVLVGREEELRVLYDELICGTGKMMVSAVGGLGKTELAKAFLAQIMDAPTNQTGIESIAWIPYDNHDLCLSMKQALRLQCDLDEVWQTVQAMASEYRERLLLVVDNIEDSRSDEYLRKLSSLRCRILVTSRQKSLSGFPQILYLQPLSMSGCHSLFYRHYQFAEKDDETVKDIIDLAARLTIMIVFIAKAAYLEGLSLRELYRELVEKGFKLSEEDVSCEHEKLQNDETIIRQMCILFSLVNYTESDKTILTYISVIPNLQFDFSKAKKWFGISKNSSLMKLYGVGMLEHSLDSRKHIYWMHSVIAAAVREQQKSELYHLSRPFIDILSEELDAGPMFGREYEKAYLIPFSWSVTDIMESHWCDEKDADFLTSLFHVCFACSNYSLCEKLIDIIIEIQKDPQKFSYMDLAYSYRNKIDMLLQFDRAAEASEVFEEVEALFEENHASKSDRIILSSQYGILYQIRGDYKKSRIYFEECIDAAMNSKEKSRQKDLSTAYSNMGRMLLDAGDFSEAYKYIKMAIEAEGEDKEDSDLIICYSTLGSICTELMSAGFGTTYVQEAMDSFETVIRFREKKLGRHHADTAVAYHDYAYFWYICGVYDKALKYNEMAYDIERELFSDYSITRMRSLNTKALIIWEQGDYRAADEIFENIIETSSQMSDDYLTDVADFEFNYARCLHDQGDVEGAIEYYNRCIAIWAGMSDGGNRKQMMAHQELGDIFFSQGEIPAALANYEKAIEYNTEDLYIQVDVMDSFAACLLLDHQTEQGILKLKELLELLVEYDMTDSETKYQLCSNLRCILEAESEDERQWKALLTEQIDGNKALVEYVNNFFINSEEK